MRVDVCIVTPQVFVNNLIKIEVPDACSSKRLGLIKKQNLSVPPSHVETIGPGIGNHPSPEREYEYRLSIILYIVCPEAYLPITTW